MKEIDSFGKFAGVRVNWEKSKAMSLVERNYREVNGLMFSDEPIKCLGVLVYVGENVKEVEK